ENFDLLEIVDRASSVLAVVPNPREKTVEFRIHPHPLRLALQPPKIEPVVRRGEFIPTAVQFIHAPIFVAVLVANVIPDGRQRIFGRVRNRCAPTVHPPWVLAAPALAHFSKIEHVGNRPELRNHQWMIWIDAAKAGPIIARKGVEAWII